MAAEVTCMGTLCTSQFCKNAINKTCAINLFLEVQVEPKHMQAEQRDAHFNFRQTGRMRVGE